MQAPGEALLEKLWATLTEKGIGALLRPWQIRRDGRANTDVRRDELLTLAQAEHDAEQIRRGNVRLLGRGPQATLVPTPTSAASSLGSPDQPTIEHEHVRTAEEIANEAAAAENLRREVNVAKALVHAETVLESDAQEPPEAKIDDDWLFRWRDSASTVSADYLQHLWGRVLAGELKAPGSFSLRTLEFLRNISQDEARAIEKLASFVLSGLVYRDKRVSDSLNLPFSFLLEMQDLGLLSGVETGLEITLPSSEDKRFIRLLVSGQLALIIKDADPTKQLKLPVYKITPIGREVLSLGVVQPDSAYLRYVGESICKLGFEVSIGRYFNITKDQIRFFEDTPLCPKGTP
jgi:hypothetical protein